jgi:hypothetical protein
MKHEAVDEVAARLTRRAIEIADAEPSGRKA